ncbi:MAG TPA: copper amine oxidase N-terminal domain-containing protein [Fimbriimonadaceae bacterium]|nr:copper amine oxidase N-terminal domain-containing protein [Fimbriimonadaceae bacterium]
MKRSFKAVCTGLVVVALAAVASAQQVQVQVDGNAVSFPNAQPQYVNGRVLVPLRGVFQQLGANVSWNQYDQTVSAQRGSTDVELKIGSRTATVNGSPVMMDVPPMIIDGTTMVPIRFVSEALGAQVGWMDAQQLVTITTPGNETAVVTSPPRRLHRVMIRANDVIPVSLNRRLSSVDSRQGDRFTATVRSGMSAEYIGLPDGTMVIGHVAAVHPRKGDQPGILDLSFDRIKFPDGHTTPINGSLTSLDNSHVRRNDNGVLIARTDKNAKDNRMVYAGYGAGAGLLVGVLTNRPLIEDTVIGGALGYILGQVQHDRNRPSNVTLVPGTEMGVRIHRDIRTSW